MKKNIYRNKKKLLIIERNQLIFIGSFKDVYEKYNKIYMIQFAYCLYLLSLATKKIATYKRSCN